MTKDQCEQATLVAETAIREMKGFIEGLSDTDEANTLMRMATAYAQDIRMVVSVSELHNFMETLEKGDSK